MNSIIDEIYSKICLKIKIERVKRKLSQEKFAEIANISRISVVDIENNKTSPTLHMLIKIANVFNITVSELTDISKIEF